MYEIITPFIILYIYINCITGFQCFLCAKSEFSSNTENTSASWILDHHHSHLGPFGFGGYSHKYPQVNLR